MIDLEPSSPDAATRSNESQEPGLWLWHGEAPASGEAAPLAPPGSRLKRIMRLLGSAAQRVGPKVTPNALAGVWLTIIGLTAWAVLHLLSGGEPVPGNTPIASPLPVASQAIVRPARPLPPAAVTVARLDPLPAPASTAQTVKPPPERRAVKSRASHRSRLARRVHASFVQAWVSDPCRYSCDNWTAPMTWHGGGY